LKGLQERNRPSLVALPGFFHVANEFFTEVHRSSLLRTFFDTPGHIPATEMFFTGDFFYY